MKIFKIYAQIDEYVLLKCPHCEKKFRSPPQDKIFGKERKNAKCQKCEEMFDFNSIQLDQDDLFKSWNPWNDKEMIMINPEGKQSFFKKDKVKTPEITSAKEIGEK